MKKIILLLLPLLFLTFSCEMESEPPKVFEGTWTNAESGDIFTFTSKSFNLVAGDSSWNIKQKGSLTEVNDTTMSLTATHIYGDGDTEIPLANITSDLGNLALFIYDDFNLTWSVNGSNLTLTSNTGSSSIYIK